MHTQHPLVHLRPYFQYSLTSVFNKRYRQCRPRQGRHRLKVVINCSFFSRSNGNFTNCSTIGRVLLIVFLLGKVPKQLFANGTQKLDKEEHRAGARYKPCAPRIATPHCTG